MKINMCGGVLTMPYNLAKHLRNKNIDVKLFVDSNMIDESYSPVWEDEELNEDGLPFWIEKQNVSLPRLFMGFSNERNFLKRLNDCDLIHAHGESCIWASFTKKHYVFQSYGFDLDYMPFNKTTLKHRMLSYLMRRGIKKASRILMGPYQIGAVKKIGIPSNKCFYQYWGIDTDKYKRVDTSLGNEIKKKYRVDLIFFHPTRHEWGTPKKIDKGNDKLILAFSKFLKITQKKALLIFIEKGNDITRSKELINKLDLQNNILWLNPMDKKNLIEYYSISDIVFDQFTVGDFGQIFLESMACGKPTYIYLKDHKEYYDELPPAINVFLSDDMVSEMVKLTDNHDYRIEIGNKSREWILKYHDWNVVTDKYISLYEKILGL